MLIHLPRRWELPERLVTPEHLYLDRRTFLRAAGFATAGLLLGPGRSVGRTPQPTFGPYSLDDFPRAPALDLYPATRNASYTVDRPLTDERTASQFNNFYEFTTDKDVFRYVREYNPYPWTLEVGGLCDAPKTWDLDALMRAFGLEERVYRFRCVEAWSMVVPWTGFPLAKLVRHSQPRSEARFVRFVSFDRPDEAPGQKRYDYYKWPYYEALRLDEALNELALFTVGIYGHPLPKQHGAPWRLIVPWKYGYKSAKSIVKMEFTKEQPQTFWNEAQPREYGFHSNVNPGRPHPRWSQATEKPLGGQERIPTLMYNGYAAQVGRLYPNEDPF